MMRIQLREFFLAFFLAFIFGSKSAALEPIPLEKVDGFFPVAQPPATSTYVRTLQNLSQNEHLRICRQDLQDFIARLKPADITKLSEQKTKFKGSILSAMLKENFKDKLKYPKLAKPDIDEFGKVVSLLIPHGKTKCVISIHPDLETDQLKSSVNLGKQEVFFTDGHQDHPIEPTLVGVSASIEEGLEVHLDGSKAMKILKQVHRLGMRDQIIQLQNFRKIESLPPPEHTPARVKKTAT